MENSQLTITITASDIKASEFKKFFDTNFDESVLTSKIETVEKVGRSALTDFIYFAFQNEVSKSIMCAILFEIIKFYFLKLKNSFGAKPKAVIKLKNDIVINVNFTMSDDDIKKNLLESIENNLKSIHFDN